MIFAAPTAFMKPWWWALEPKAFDFGEERPPREASPFFRLGSPPCRVAKVFVTLAKEGPVAGLVVSIFRLE